MEKTSEILLDSTGKRISNAMRKQTDFLYQIALADKPAVNDWVGIQKIVQNGDATKFFNIGDQLTTEWKDTLGGENNTVYEVPMDIVKFGDVTLEDGSIIPGMYLQWHYCLPFGVQFDAKEPENSDANIKQYGYNRWAHSGLRQFLNSNETKNNWWKSMHEHDVAPEQLSTTDGFLCGFQDPKFLNAIKPTKITTSKNTVTDDGSIETTYDKFFLPSLEQIYAQKQIAGEGDVFEYWKEAVGTPEPNGWWSGNANQAYKIYSIDNKTSSQVVFLRSALRGNSCNVWTLTSDGYVYDGNFAYFASRCSPVCVVC